MKIKKILTALTCAALITSAALPLTACGGAKSLKKAEGSVNLADYAVEYESTTTYGHDAVTKAEEKFTGYKDAGRLSYSPYIKCRLEVDGKSYYNVINGYTGNSMYSNLADASVITRSLSNPSSNQYYILEAKRSTGGADFYDYLGEDGTTFVSNVNKSDYANIPSFSVKEYYVGDDTEKSEVLVMTIGDNKTYFKAEKKDGLNTYDEISEQAVHFLNPKYAADSVAFDGSKPVYSKTGETPVTDETADYSYKRVGNEYVFSKNGTETGRVNIEGVDDDYIFFVSNYMYYKKEVSVEKNSKDVNLIFTRYDEQRYHYELHRYDFVADKDKELNYNIYIGYIEPLYNKTAKKFDALVLGGAKIKNNTYQYNSEFTYITNADLGVAYDLGDVASDGKLYSLGESNYMLAVGSRKTIFDADMKKLSEFETAYYYDDRDFIGFGVTDDDGYTQHGVADFNGNIIIEPMYSSIDFYGEYAFTHNNITREDVLLRTDGTEKVAPESEGNMAVVNSENGYYLTFDYPTTPTTGSLITYYQMCVYGFDGNRIGTVDKVIEKTGFTYTVVGNTMIVPVYDDANKTQTYSLVYIA